MKRIIRGIAVMAYVITPLLTANAQVGEPQLVWETGEFSVPESVLVTDEGQIFVANIGGTPGEKDGNGTISLLGPEGEIIEREWAGGLNAPKGMAMMEGSLYVADIDRIVKIDAGSGEILLSIDVEGSQFLNDLAALPDGRLICSDSRTGKLHTFHGDKHSGVIQDSLLQRPNGLLFYEGMVLVGCADRILRLDLEMGRFEILIDATGPVDGLVSPHPGVFIISDWAGKVQLLREGQPGQVLINTTDEKINAADMAWDQAHGRLLIPTFFDNRVRAYEVSF